MSLERQITDQYEHRAEKDRLYSGEYARRSLRERTARITRLVGRLRKPGDTILEIGAGHGDNVPIFLSCGFREQEICLNEMLPVRIANIRNSFPSICLYEGDALKVEFRSTFTWVFQSTVFTSILDAGDRRRLAAKMWQMLKPGGFILWYDFIYNNPSNPDVRGVSITETRSLFPLASWSEVHRVTLAPPLGRRVGKLYALFNVPFLRSHILAVFQKPQ